MDQGIKLAFRPVGPEDIALLFDWNHIPEVVRYLPSMPKPLLWEQHVEWAERALAQKGRADFMITAGPLGQGLPRPIGRVHASELTSWRPEVGVLIGDQNMWGRGVATEAIAYIVAWLMEREIWLECIALIHPDNAASIKAFENNRFTLVREAKTNSLSSVDLLATGSTPTPLTPMVGRGGQHVYRRALR